MRALACAALAGLATPAMAGSPGGAVTDNRKLDCYVLLQNSVLTADHRITITRAAIKDESLKSGAVAIMKEPFDEVVIFNAKTKLYIKQPLAHYHGFFQKGIILISGRSLSEMPLDKAGNGTLRGVKTEIYKSPPAAVARAKAQARKGESRNGDPVYLTLVVSKQVSENAKMAKFVSISYGLPVKQGMPLKADYLDADDDAHAFLETSRVNRTQVSASEFNIPSGLKPAKEVNAVFVDTKAAGAELLF